MEKKYVKNYESFLNDKAEPVNEELFGAIVNFLKGLWKKAAAKIKEIGDDWQAQVKYKEEVLFDPTDVDGIWGPIWKEYNAKPQFNDQDCFDLISKMVDPDDSPMSQKSIQEFILQLPEDMRKEEQVAWELVRNRALVFFQYGGATAKAWVPLQKLATPAIKPDLKTGKAIQRTPDNKGFVDQTHLPLLKKVIAPLTDDKKKAAVINWVKTIFVKKMIEINNALTEDEVKKYSGGDKQDANIFGTYGAKDENELVGKDVYYKMEAFDPKAPKKEAIGKANVQSFDENKGLLLKTEKGTQFYKDADSILSKDEAEKILGIKAGEGEAMNYESLNKIFGEGKEVIFLLPGVDKTKYDPKKSAEEQKEVVGTGKMKALNDQNKEDSVTFDHEGKEIKMGYGQVIGEPSAQQENADAAEAAKELGEIKDDPEKMKRVANYAKFLKDARPEDVEALDDLMKGK